jgi:hypothetical protein
MYQEPSLLLLLSFSASSYLFVLSPGVSFSIRGEVETKSCCKVNSAT